MEGGFKRVPQDVLMDTKQIAKQSTLKEGLNNRQNLEETKGHFIHVFWKTLIYLRMFIKK